MTTSLPPADDGLEWAKRTHEQIIQPLLDKAFDAGLEKAALYHDGEAERIRRDNGDIARSLAAMVTEWVEGGINFGTDWRSGLADVIERRLARFTRASDNAAAIRAFKRGAK